MTVLDPGKLLLFALALVGAFLLIILGRSPEVGGGVIIYITGYLTGNGRLAKRGEPPVPAIGPSPAD